MKNLQKLFVLALLLFALALTGCSSMQSLDVSKHTKIYNSDFKKVFNACKTYCSIKGFMILASDENQGIINTDYIEDSEFSPDFLIRNRVKFNFMVREINPSSTKLILTGAIENFDDRWVASSLTEGMAVEFYGKVFKGISEQL